MVKPQPSATFEKLGLFYLGRPYDLATKQPRDGVLLYDSKDLVTHAVCVGMTGSGKTGLCLGLLEEAALDGIPVIAIDPKGDMGNLLLTFPGLSRDEFRPWINEDDARRKNLPADEYAAQQAKLWQQGLADWNQDGGRIQRLRNAADFTIYTPGSSAGLPLSILESFAAPPTALLNDAELLAEQLNTTTTSLLTLAGVDAEPVRSREHVLVSTILRHVWKEGRDCDLAALIAQIQQPPLRRIGVLDIGAFYPDKDRVELAMRLNQLLAAPGFELWLQGEPLDIGRLLYTAEGRPRVSILSIAHLGDAERMSFVSLLLNQVLGWTRGQSGTASLRAILYMDEIYGYCPPVANPPSKAPLLTLLKQARAYGLGVVLATQNPVDLDYKGLSNTGTWFLGRLQTERDKARVLDGLEGVAAGSGVRFDRRTMDPILAGLSSRVFLMHNVHEDAPEVFETRWVMSYLRGPLTRDQIRTLMANRQPVASRPAPGVPPSAGQTTAARSALRKAKGPLRAAERPVLPPDIPQYFVPLRKDGLGEDGAEYAPFLYASATLEFADRTLKLSELREVAFLAPIQDGAVPVEWRSAEATDVAPADLEAEPAVEAMFDQVPSAAGRAKSYAKWSKEFAAWLCRSQVLELRRSSQLNLVSKPGESERDFLIRLREVAHEIRDEATSKLRQKYESKLTALAERIRKAEQAVEREVDQAKVQKLQTAVSLGATLLSAVLGRRVAQRSTLGRATTAARGVSRTMKERKDIRRAQDTVNALQARLVALEATFESEIEALESDFDPLNEPLETISIKPKKRDINVKLVALAWCARIDLPEQGLHP